MRNETGMECTFKKKDRVTPIETNSTVTINSESVPVDPLLLFQRFVTAAGDLYDNPAKIFKYELCSFPSALFESPSLMRAANKTALVDAIWALGECNTTNNTLVNTEIYVLSLMVVLPYNVIHGHEEQYSIDYISYIETMLPRTIQILLLSLTDETGSSTKDNTNVSSSTYSI